MSTFEFAHRGRAAARARTAARGPDRGVRRPLAQPGGSARALTPEVRTDLEARYGAELGHVRLHTDGGWKRWWKVRKQDPAPLGRADLLEVMSEAIEQAPHLERRTKNALLDQMNLEITRLFDGSSG